MNANGSADQISEEMIDIFSEDYLYLDSEDRWLSSDSNQTLNVKNNSSTEDIRVWIRDAFCSEKSRGTHMTLVNKLDELKLMSPSIDSRTFTRKRNQIQKRQSIFTGGLSSLCSPVNEDDCSPEANDKTFEVFTTRKSMNGTFSFAKPLAADSTFTLENCTDEDIQLNNIDDVEKIAKKQEDSLRQSCSNGWSPPNERSPTRNQMITNRMNANINSNTLTKSRDPNRYARLEADLNSYHMNGNEEPYYENGISPENSFKPHISYTTSTPLVQKYRTLAQEVIREPIATKIMPDVSNLRTNSSYSRSKVGKSEPNLSLRLQPMVKGLGYNSIRQPNQLMSNRTGNPMSNNFLQAKVGSDSRLLVKNGLKLPQNQSQTVGRVTSPPPSQSQQLLRKVAVEGELNRMGTTTANTTNLCRKSTFRVRDYSINSEENLKENGINCGNGLTNTSASTNGYKTNKTNNNNVQTLTKMSKIPGPKSIRSGIPVSGQRTAIPCPTNTRAANSTDNWSNGCY